jgi:hypothetical protein
MPVHVEDLTSQVTVVPGDLPIPPAQVEMLVGLVLKRLEKHLKDAERTRDATQLRQSATPKSAVSE